MIIANFVLSLFFIISFITFFTIIIYLLTNDFHNRGVKWDVVSFIRFLNVIVYKDYIYIYIYIKLNEMSKKGF